MVILISRVCARWVLIISYAEVSRPGALSRRLAALRAWRTARAREDAVPPYVVFHDQTLAAIADVKPPSAAALRRVKGVGPAKIEAYGDEVLALVAKLR